MAHALLGKGAFLILYTMESNKNKKAIEQTVKTLDQYHNLIKECILEHGEIPENMPDIYISTLVRADHLLNKPSLIKLRNYLGL